MSGDMKAPVSVVIPCYRCRSTIQRAVASVAVQTWQPTELILVDDASDDGTLEILHALQESFSDDWIKVISLTRNGGPAVARNVGWDMSAQPYIAFLDADDAWHPRKLAIQYDYMTAHPDIVLTGHDYVLVKDIASITNRLPQKWGVKPISKLRFMLISRYFLTPTIMLKKDISCRFPIDIRYAEDRFLWLAIISKGNKTVYLDIPLTYLYKASYGQGGLSKNLWNMEKGELTGFNRLYSLKLLSKKEFLLCYIFSLFKYVRRKCIVLLRK